MGKAVKITLARPNAGRPPGVFRLRKYGDPVMVNLMGLDVAGLGTTNFQNIDLFSPAPGYGFGAISKWQELKQAQLDYLVGIQPTDAGPLRTKMSFLIGNKEESGTPERPYWTSGAGAWGTEWKTYKLRPGERFFYGTMVFGGQLVLVETNGLGKPVEYQFMAKYQGPEIVSMQPFYKLVGLRWADRHKYTHQTAPWFIQRGTWADWGNEYVDTWHSGAVYHPVWSPLDFPPNSKTDLYVAREFLEKE